MSLQRYLLALTGAALAVAVLTSLAVRLGTGAGAEAVLVLAAVASAAAWALYRFVGPLFGHLHEATGRLARGDLSCMMESFAAPGEFGRLAENVRKICKGMVKHLGGMVRNVGSLEDNAGRIGSGSEQVVLGARRQAEGVGEAASLMQAYEDRNRESAALSRQAEELAFATGDLAAQGAAKIERVRNCIGDIRVQVSAVEEAAGRIADTAARIAAISGQTDFLALSAAIEASRAAEHGRGFATVAGQVARLAGAAGRQTAEIAGITEGVRRGVDDTKAAVQEGLTKLERFEASFADIGAKAAQALAMAREVGVRLQEQEETAGTVLANVRSIASVAGETAATAEAAGAVTAGIAGVAARFREVADTYRL